MRDKQYGDNNIDPQSWTRVKDKDAISSSASVLTETIQFTIQSYS